MYNLNIPKLYSLGRQKRYNASTTKYKILTKNVTIRTLLDVLNIEDLSK